MFKKIISICLMIISSFAVSMENVSIMLGYVKNKSELTYCATYGPGHKTIFYPNQEFNLNHCVFNVTPDSKDFPIKSNLTLEELPDDNEIQPNEHLLDPLIKHLLSFSVSPNFGFRVAVDPYIKSNNFQIKANTHYLLNLLINQNNNISWKLMQRN